MTHAFEDLEGVKGILLISRGTSILLLFVYCAYLYFQVSCKGKLCLDHLVHLHLLFS